MGVFLCGVCVHLCWMWGYKCVYVCNCVVCIYLCGVCLCRYVCYVFVWCVFVLVCVGRYLFVSHCLPYFETKSLTE